MLSVHAYVAIATTIIQTITMSSLKSTMLYIIPILLIYMTLCYKRAIDAYCVISYCLQFT